MIIERVGLAHIAPGVAHVMVFLIYYARAAFITLTEKNDYIFTKAPRFLAECTSRLRVAMEYDCFSAYEDCRSNAGVK